MSNRPPTNIHEMLRAGYKRLRDGTCKECKASIAWFRTTNGSYLAVNLPITNNYERVIVHKETCPNREALVGPAKRAADLTRSREQAVDELCRTTGAQIVVAVYPEGPVMQWLNGLKPEEARQDLISAGNKLRWQLMGGVKREEV